MRVMPRFYTDPNQLKITTSYGAAGVHYTLNLCTGNEVSPVALPLGTDIRRFVGQTELARLTLLDGLWEEEVLIQPESAEPGSYMLPIQAIYSLDPVQRRVLRLPEPASVQVSLATRGAVGLSSFAVEPRVRHPELGMLHRLGRRDGAFYVLHSGQTVLVELAVARLLDEVARAPERTSDQPQYVARVKAAALQAGAELDGYLSQENYHLVDDLELDVVARSPEHIALQPRLSQVPPEVETSLLNELSESAEYGSVRERNGGRHRVFYGPRAQRQIREWQQKPEVRGTDVARFLQNPAPFAPASIDLERFSDRVKGLSLRVYRARPYLAANPTERGWFELDVGVRLEPAGLISHDQDEADGQSIAETEDRKVLSSSGDRRSRLDVAEFERLTTVARSRGDEYVFWKDAWVQVPSNAEQFVTTTRETLLQHPDGRIDVARLPYVLDIYTNIEDLEYSPELVRQRAEMAAEESGEEPDGFQGELMPHQRDGLSWIKRLHRLHLGGLLADDMGLGKTIQVLAFMAFLHQQGQLRPSLVALPRAVLEHWALELQRFCPHLKWHAHGGANRSLSAEFLAGFDVVLTTYETLARDQLLLGQIDWRFVVCDEAQKIKNMTALATNAAKALKCRTRLAVTGTPVENNLGELWCIVDFARPGLFGSYQEFRRRFELPLKDGKTDQAGRIEEELRWTLSPIYKRRTKAEHLKDQLPEKQEEKLLVPLGRRQREVYQEILDKAHRQRGEALGALQRLLQVCCHPGLLDEGWQAMSARELQADVPKLEATLRVLDKIEAAGEKALIVTHWQGMQQILQRLIWERYEVYAKVINGESVDRRGMVDRFSAHIGFSVMIISPKAGGVGLNLVSANHVVHYSRWWNPAVENQATDRVYRIGQTRPVRVHFPIVTADSGQTVEQVLDTLLEEKRQLASSVIVPSSVLSVDQADVAARLGLKH